MFLESKKDLIIRRANALKTLRSFFENHHVTEVDTNILSKYGCIDPHLDLMRVSYAQGKTGFLHSSPEYNMKILLSEIQMDIYQISHVFRQSEIGERHHPEFTMIEWYRIDYALEQMIEETCLLIETLLGPLEKKRTTFQKLFVKNFNLCPFTTSTEELLKIAKEKGLQNVADKEGLLQFLWDIIEKNMETDKATIVEGFPASWAALSHIDENDNTTCKRFEIYYNHLELANGYFEMTGEANIKNRKSKADMQRLSFEKEIYPINPKFISAHGNLPKCSGVAVGFDRLMMALLNTQNIHDVLPSSLPFEDAITSTLGQ